MYIYLDSAIRFETNELSDNVESLIKRTFRVKSPEYVKSDNKRCFSNDDKYITMYDISDNYMSVPRGCVDELINIFDTAGVEYDIIDNRLLCDDIDFPETTIDFYKHQKKIIKKGYAFTQGTFEAGCGSGKTIALIGLILKCRQPALIIVPDKTLQQQWIRNIHDVLGLKYSPDLKWFDDHIGMIGDGVYEYKKCWITVAINASVYSHIKDEDLFKSFGFVAMDEAHMVGARTFRTSIHLFPARYRFGATATAFRNDNLSWFIEAYCGRKFCTITDEELEQSNLLIKPKLIVRHTDFKFNVNFNYRNWYMTVMKYLVKDKRRNALICKDIINNSIKRRRLALVVSTSVNHCNYIAKGLQALDPGIRVGFLTEIRGGSGLSWKNVVTENVERLASAGKLDVVFGVNRVKQGLDISPIEDVYTIAPRKSKVDVTQIIGRCMRPDKCFGKYKDKSDKKPCVYDYVDHKIQVFAEQFKNYRLPVYEERCIIERSKK